MTTVSSYSKTLLNTTWWGPHKILTAASLSCVLACSAASPEPADEKPTAAAASSATTYKVPQSTPIDRVIQTVYANSPLNATVLRKVLTEANPQVITGNPQQRVKAGTSITVPDHGHVLKNILTPHVAAAPETQEPGPSARDHPARRQWVRFP